MREELLDIIRCPACGNFKRRYFDLIKDEVDSLEIRKGKVACGVCHRAFDIKNGILDLLYKPDREVLEEIDGNIRAAEENHPKHTDEMLLSLPESAESQNPLDSTHGYSLNFYKVLEELKITGGELVLDLGSGTTWSANKLAQKGARCVALDISQPKFKGLGSADTYFRHNGVYYDRVASDMKDLPFINGSFDIVMTNSSIHHGSNLKSVLKEINRVLKERGKLALINEAVCGIFSIRRDNRRRYLPEFVRRFHWTENTYSITQYLRYIKAEGFGVRVFYPPSVDKRLSGLRKIKLDFRSKGIKYRLAYLVAHLRGSDAFCGIAKNDAFCGIAKKVGFWLAMMIFGLPLVLIAEKTGTGQLA